MLTIRSLVNEVIQSHTMTATQQQTLNSLLIRSRCSTSDLEALDQLTAALQRGDVQLITLTEAPSFAS